MLNEKAQRPILYSFRRCPYAMRARLAILLAGLSVELREILLRDKPDHMVALSPKATVPVLQLIDGQVIDESIDVMRWASRNGRSHQGCDLDEALLDDPLRLLFDAEFKHHLDRYKYASRFENADALENRQAGLEILRATAAQKKGGWLKGDHPCMLDIALLPFIRQYRIADPIWFDAEPSLSPVREWLEQFLAWSPFQIAMMKYAVWQEGEAGVEFPPA